MSWMVLTPAYGRDYKSKKEVEEAWNAGKDFVVEPIGKYINKLHAPAGSYEIRYSKLRKAHVIHHTPENTQG